MSDGPSQRATIQGPVSVAFVPHRRRPHFLEQIKGAGSPARFELGKDSMILGRDAGVDIALVGDKVSRKHGVIRRANHEYSIADLDSSHGIYLNGIKVHSAVLRDGDAVQLGDAVFLYHEG